MVNQNWKPSKSSKAPVMLQVRWGLFEELDHL
jgi:hypothetical protein